LLSNESICVCRYAAGATAAEADAHYLRAVTLHALGRAAERNAAAREFRRQGLASQSK
jgi:hypothetical protein